MGKEQVDIIERLKKHKEMITKRMNEAKRKWYISEEELDDDQLRILYAKNGSHVVEGCAGSGKTTLALHKLRDLISSDEESILFLVYTVSLQTFITDGAEELIKNLNNNYNIYTIDTFFSKHYDKQSKYDYILIDEVQDIEYDRLKKLNNICKKDIILYGDDNQQIFLDFNENHNLKIINIRKKLLKLDDSRHYILNKNYRLPKKIARFAGKIIKDKGLLESKCDELDGDIIVNKYIDLDAELLDIINIIDKNSLLNVGILFPNNDGVLSGINTFKENYENEDNKVEYKYIDENGKIQENLRFNTDNPKLLTYHSSKGLEFQHVFVVACNEIRKPDVSNYRESFYVACTRTRGDLYLSYNSSVKNPEIRALLENIKESR